MILSANIPCSDQGSAETIEDRNQKVSHFGDCMLHFREDANDPKEHQDGDYLATVTISGNVDMAEQLINERLREQFHPR